MRTIEARDVQGIFKTVIELVKSGEAVKVQAPSDQVIVMSEREYNEITKARKNAEYDAKLDRSIQEARNGEIIFKTLEELKGFER